MTVSLKILLLLLVTGTMASMSNKTPISVTLPHNKFSEKADLYKTIDEIVDCNSGIDSESGSEMFACDDWLSTPATTAYVSAGDIDISGNQITVEANFNRSSIFDNGLEFGKLVSKHTGPENVNYSLMPLQCEITTDVTGYVASPQTCRPDQDKSYHVAMVYDGSNLKFYRDGYLLTITPCTGNLVNNDLLTTIGQISGNSFSDFTQFKGYINEVRIWNVARTQAEIRSFMNSSLPDPPAQTGLVAYYTFNNLLNKQGNAAYNGSLIGNANLTVVNPNCDFTLDLCQAALPVRISSFYGLVNYNNSCNLYWDFEDLNSLEKIELEKSTDGVSFISTATFILDDKDKIYNSFTDLNIPTGTRSVFYRLKLTEYSGSVKFSHIINVNFKKVFNKIQLFPNPADNSAIVVYNAEEASTATIKLFDFSGKEVLIQQSSLSKGINRIELTDLTKLKNGIYMLVFRQDAETTSLKVLINH